MAEILQCRNLTKLYNGFPALYNLNMSIPAGKIIGLLGPNGSGKTTLIKLTAGLLTPTAGDLLVDGMRPGIETKHIVSYLPERTYLNDWMNVEQILRYFSDFYPDFDAARAVDMLGRLGVNLKMKLKTMSKGTKEKVQLVLVMSRRAKLYLLDEPIGGVDPAARDFILDTILTNYNPDSTVLISTHLIADVEKVLDEFLFLKNGEIVQYNTVDAVRAEQGKSVDELFREVFKC